MENISREGRRFISVSAMSEDQKPSEVESMRRLVRLGSKKMLTLMHYELDRHFDQETGKPAKRMSEACVKKAKIVFDQVRRDYGLNKPIESGTDLPDAETGASIAAAETKGKKLGISDLTIVGFEAKTG